jgi:hypothetical protein
MTATRALAKTVCDPLDTFNQMAVRFLEGKEKIPATFMVATSGRRFRVNKSGEEGLWVFRNSPAINGGDSLRAELNVEGYDIVSAGGSNEDLGTGCYAVFNFRANKTSAYVEVAPTPPSPFRYRKNGAQEVPASPKQGNGWNVVGKLAKNDSVALKVYETSATGPDVYLFTVGFNWDFKQIKKNIDDIANSVLGAREVFRYGLQTELPSDIDPKSDPYIKFAKITDKMTDGNAKELVREVVKESLRLRSLEILDRTEIP